MSCLKGAPGDHAIHNFLMIAAMSLRMDLSSRNHLKAPSGHKERGLRGNL